jgi:hypothetical protein
MKITFDLKYLLGAITAFALAFMTVTYKLDQYIEFAGEGNAFAFFVASLFAGVICLICSFEKTNKDK